MCRFIAYTGHPLLLDDVLVKPTNSLINQSVHARESIMPLNGDGFGLGWYVHDIEHTPGLFKSVQPAWNNLNLLHITPKIKSTCFFAHIRAASAGGVTHYNCHPFYHDELMFMHNGSIANFPIIKRHLRHLLDDDIYEWVKGQTDSEHAFGLFLQKLKDKNQLKFEPKVVLEILRETFDEIEKLQQEFVAYPKSSFLNIALTNGREIIAARYSSNEKDIARTLYYSMGSRYEYKDGICHMQPSTGANGAVVISSEKLTEYKAEWHEIHQNHFVIVDKNLDVSLEKINN